MITIDIETPFEKKNSTLIHDRNLHQIWYREKISQKGIYDKDGPFDIYDRNGMNLTETEDIKWQEYTEELYKEDVHKPDNYDLVITHLEPDILECEVKWALGSITMNKLVEVMEFQLSYFKSWKMMLWKCCTPKKLSSGHRTGKSQFSSQSQRKTMPKNVQTTTQLHSSHTPAKQCSKFSKPGFNSTWTMNFQMFKLDLEKAEEPKIKLPTYVGS